MPSRLLGLRRSNPRISALVFFDDVNIARGLTDPRRDLPKSVFNAKVFIRVLPSKLDNNPGEPQNEKQKRSIETPHCSLWNESGE